MAGWTKRRAVAEPSYLEVRRLAHAARALLSPKGRGYVFLLATPAVVCLLDCFRDVDTAKRAFTVAAMAMMALTIYDVSGRTLYFWLISIAIISVATTGLLVSLADVGYRALA